MTARQIWEYALTELSKVNAPSLMLHEFNYYINKAVSLYVNKRYNIYDTNQQTTDDLRVLKSTAILDAEKSDKYKALDEFGAGNAKLFDATYEVILPQDYLHMLNCVCIYKVNKTYKCYDKGNYVDFAAKRLTADSWSVIINDYYNRPLPERPYYYIHNVNVKNDGLLPTNPISPNNEIGTDTYANDDELANFSRTVDLTNNSGLSVVERKGTLRYSNPTGIRCEIRYGRDDSVFKLEKVLVDYIKSPLFIRLTKEQVDLTEDTSQIMEFPDYVCQEIINELVTLLMARDADPRLQVQAQVSLSIATPTQQLTIQPALAARAVQA